MEQKVSGNFRRAVKVPGLRSLRQSKKEPQPHTRLADEELDGGGFWA